MHRSLLPFLVSLLLAYPAQAQDARKVPISFLPPPLETATFSLGIYDTKSGKLVRRLKEAATQNAFTVGLNGLITEWDGKDNAGKLLPPGRYAARGYAVGALKVEGDEILGNDWASSDENLRIKRIHALNALPSGDTLVVLATMADGNVRVLCFAASGDKVRWISQPLVNPDKAPEIARHSDYSLLANDGYVSAHAGGNSLIYDTTDGHVYRGDFDQAMEASGPTCMGKDGTRWKVEAGILRQYSQPDEMLRQLTVKPGDPVPIAVAASKTSDRLYLLEEAPGWQRVRGLSWVETKEEEGKPVSTWQTFFERNIHAGDLTVAPGKISTSLRINLVKNPLDPGKPQQIELDASVDDAGSYLTTADGLRLRRISELPNLKSAHLGTSKGEEPTLFFQYDGTATDRFSIVGIRNMMAFDAGEIDMTVDGEKQHTEKAAEPPEP